MNAPAATVSKAHQMGRLDCRLGLSPAYAETGDGRGFLRLPDRARLTTAEQEQTARDYLAGYRAALACGVRP